MHHCETGKALLAYFIGSMVMIDSSTEAQYEVLTLQ